MKRLACPPVRKRAEGIARHAASGSASRVEPRAAMRLSDRQRDNSSLRRVFDVSCARSDRERARFIRPANQAPKLCVSTTERRQQDIEREQRPAADAGSGSCPSFMTRVLVLCLGTISPSPQSIDTPPLASDMSRFLTGANAINASAAACRWTEARARLVPRHKRVRAS